jgi:hypothetical protein
MGRPELTGSDTLRSARPLVPPTPRSTDRLWIGDTMGGDSYSTTAARRLRTLQAEHLTPARRPSDGMSRPTRVHASAPIDLDVLDYIEAAAHEVIAHTRTAVPAAGPAPQGIDEVYAWAERATSHLEAERQQIRDALMVRQGLEHALRAGNESVIRREPCPRCACWGLFWSRHAQVATCVNKRCTMKGGRASRWSLQQLAEHHVARKAAALRNAT